MNVVSCASGVADSQSRPSAGGRSFHVNARSTSWLPDSSAAGVAPSASSSLRTITWFRSSSKIHTRWPSPTSSCLYGFCDAPAELARAREQELAAAPICVTRPPLSATVCVNCARAVCVSRTNARRRSSVGGAGAAGTRRERDAEERRAGDRDDRAGHQIDWRPELGARDVREAVPDRIEDQVRVLQAALVLASRDVPVLVHVDPP